MPRNVNETLEAIASNVTEIMKALGIKPTESNEDTPKRVSKMLVTELFRNVNNENIEELNKRMKVFSVNTEFKVTEPITVTVPFYSMCEHHWLPFFGTAKITYVPNETIIGLSKIPRVVKYFSRKPQLQERLTAEIGEYLCSLLKPLSLSVDMEAEHMCVSMRGAESSCKTITHWES